MIVVAIIIGGLTGALLAVLGTLLARQEFRLRLPRALDPAYRYSETVSCGLLVAALLKSGSVGAVVGAVLGFLVHRLAF
jgi:hypothetical protein